MNLKRPPISVTIITRDEEQNLGQALASIHGWADDILVVDSGSTDRTLEIAKSFGARTLTREWSGYGQQKNYAQDQAAHDWILNIDADEEVSTELRNEIDALLAATPGPACLIEIPRKTWYLGRWILHGGWYPNFLVRLANRKFARWTEPAVHESWVCAPGKTVTSHRLTSPLHHFTFKNISDQVITNLKYSRQGYEDLRSKGRAKSRTRLVLKPIGKFFETYLFKLGFLDGVPGLIISINAAHSMFLRQAYFFEPDQKKTNEERRP